MIFYVYKRFVKKLNFREKYIKIFRFLLIFTAILATTYLPFKKLDLLSEMVLEVFALALGAGFLFFVLTIIYELIRLFIKKKSRLFIADIAVVVITIMLIIYAFFEAYKTPEITRIEIASSKINTPIKIAHITDLHLGNSPILSSDFARQIAKLISSEKVDLVAITGDLIDAPLEKVREPLRLISQIESKHGIFFVLGNHEYMYEVDEIIEFVESLGIVVLKNSSVRIADQLVVAGSYDPFGFRLGKLTPDPDLALKMAKDDDFVVLLAHQPKVLDQVTGKKPDLALCGHTHGGQIAPFGLLVKIDQPYLNGLYKDGENSVFVSRGTGFWGPPLRLFAPSEIAVLSIVPVK